MPDFLARFRNLQTRPNMGGVEFNRTPVSENDLENMSAGKAVSKLSTNDGRALRGVDEMNGPESRQRMVRV